MAGQKKKKNEHNIYLEQCGWRGWTEKVEIFVKKTKERKCYFFM